MFTCYRTSLEIHPHTMQQYSCHGELKYYTLILYIILYCYIHQKIELGTKRPQVPAGTSSPAKRRLSPIQFDEPTGKGTGNNRKETREIYHPPRDQYSQKVSNGSFPDFDTSYTGRGGRRRGWGSRRGRGRGGWGRGGRRGQAW